MARAVGKDSKKRGRRHRSSRANRTSATKQRRFDSRTLIAPDRKLGPASPKVTAAQPAARPTDGRHYVPEWKKKEAAAREEKSLEPRDRRRVHIVMHVTDVGNLGESGPELHERLWKQFQAGNDQALLDLIVWQLGNRKLPAQEACTEFIARYDRWRFGEALTLDETFKVQRRKTRGRIRGQQFSPELVRGHIAVRVYELNKLEGMPIDRKLFEKIAKELGIGRVTVETIYYESASIVWRKIAATGRFRVTPRKQRNS